MVTKKTEEKVIQPEVNIGLIGHVDHGKTTLLERLSGVWADTHSEEMKRGITIRLGYANTTFYKTKEGFTAEKPKTSTYSRKVSFIDAPGHETLMATMLSGAAIMDGALLLVAANEQCPQPQTKEHLMALESIGVKQIVIVQNKIDLVTEKQALENYKQIKNFIKRTIAEKAPIIPISAQHNVNISNLIEAIESNIKTPKRDSKKDPRFLVARSFDINKPGSEIEKLVGGVVGGVLKQGSLKVNDEIEIKPGIKTDEKQEHKSVTTKIIAIKSGKDNINEANPGGSIALLTTLDPSIVKSDSLSGNLVSLKGKLPEVYYDLKLKPKLLDRVVGIKEESKIEPIKKGEILVLNVNSTSTVGQVADIHKDSFKINLKIPVCADKTDKFTLSRRIGTRWHLIGIADIT
ncbi:translation initiation factor IF-2 subunit gamma [archaeon]|nr:translation initiation factor IF-2 subunit gamma [archaeon]